MWRNDPTSVGDFTITSFIGRGQFGRVFKARSKVTGKIVALKEVGLGREDLMKYIARELQVMKICSGHENIVEFVTNFAIDNTLYIAMEFCEAGTLQDLMNGGLFPEELSKYYMKQLVSGMRHLSRNRVIHRDLKPENILMRRANREDGYSTTSVPLCVLKIADFGFARTISDMVRSRCGSPIYMAPEVLGNEEYDEKADVWSVGCIWYQMLTGTTPYIARTEDDLFRQMRTRNPSLPFHVEKKVSPLCKHLLINCMLQVNPNLRFNWDAVFAHPWLGFLNEQPKIPHPLPNPNNANNANANANNKINADNHNTASNNTNTSDNNGNRTGVDTKNNNEYGENKAVKHVVCREIPNIVENKKNENLDKQSSTSSLGANDSCPETVEQDANSTRDSDDDKCFNIMDDFIMITPTEKSFIVPNTLLVADDDSYILPPSLRMASENLESKLNNLQSARDFEDLMTQYILPLCYMIVQLQDYEKKFVASLGSSKLTVPDIILLKSLLRAVRKAVAIWQLANYLECQQEAQVVHVKAVQSLKFVWEQCYEFNKKYSFLGIVVDRLRMMLQQSLSELKKLYASKVTQSCLSAETLVYTSLLEMGKTAAFQELYGEFDQSATLYTFAIILLDQVAEDCIATEDKCSIGKLSKKFEARLSDIQSDGAV